VRTESIDAAGRRLHGASSRPVLPLVSLLVARLERGDRHQLDLNEER
jgi:hypothetical protein